MRPNSKRQVDTKYWSLKEFGVEEVPEKPPRQQKHWHSPAVCRARVNPPTWTPASDSLHMMRGRHAGRQERGSCSGQCTQTCILRCDFVSSLLHSVQAFVPDTDTPSRAGQVAHLRLGACDSCWSSLGILQRVSLLLAIHRRLLFPRLAVLVAIDGARCVLLRL